MSTPNCNIYVTLTNFIFEESLIDHVAEENLLVLLLIIFFFKEGQLCCWENLLVLLPLRLILIIIIIIIIFKSGTISGVDAQTRVGFGPT